MSLNDSPNDNRHDRPRPILAYLSPRVEPVQPRTPIGDQAVAGIGAWMLTGMVMAVGCGVASMTSALVAVVSIVVPLAGPTVFAAHLRRSHGWRGFIPGILIGLVATGLLPLGIFAVLYFGGR